MLSAWIYLLLNSLFVTLRLSGGGGSFPRPLKAEEEREYLKRFAEGDMEARNLLIEHNLRLVAHIMKNGESARRIFPGERHLAGLAEFQMDVKVDFLGGTDFFYDDMA